MYSYNQIKTLQIEISSYCNSACPQCPRNFFGGRTIDTLPLKKWSLNDFQTAFTEDFLKQLTQIYFCGTYGEPLTNSNLVNICEYVKHINSNIKLGIHTNGGIGSSDTFCRLAGIVDFVAFGIDGLEDTNHIYRKHVIWKKLITNARAYIDAGGHAIWDYIVFEHNQHQVKIAKKLSQQLGFAEFNVKKTSRFLNRKHKYTESIDVYNQNGTVDYQIKIPSNTEYVNQGYAMLNKNFDLHKYSLETDIKCNAYRIKEIYVGADGYVFPCGWLHDRLYGPEITDTEDYKKMHTLFDLAGGKQFANIFFTDLEMIVNKTWFPIIANSWSNESRLSRCGIMCGKKINLIGAQNTDVRYKE